ncbi:MAG: TetR/AcrR family transcriptional regulator [Pseudonocardia sp.]|nr:TetR/AcrR family transcriptional regulator [Pseudonocardia sp.]
MSTATESTGGAAPQSRVQRKRGRRIQEILTVAAELFGERGFDAVSLDDVAERLDVTKGSLYHYFASKEELVSAAIQTLGSAWFQRLRDLPAAAEGPAPARLRALIREHVTVAVQDHPAALRLFLVPDEWPPAQRAAIKELRRRHDRLFRDVVEEGVATGEFAVVDLDTALHCMHAAMAQSPIWYRRVRGAAFDRAVERLVETLMLLVGGGH